MVCMHVLRQLRHRAPDRELYFGYLCSNRVITVRRSAGNVLVTYGARGPGASLMSILGT